MKFIISAGCNMQNILNLIIEYDYLRNSLLVAVFASIASGITGPFVVKKKISMISGGIAHAVLGGMGIAYYLNADVMIGAIIFAFFFALILVISKRFSNQYEDTIISTLWSVGMSIGILFIYLKPGYGVNIQSFIFGNILMVTQSDLINLFIFDIIIILIFFIFYYHLLYVSFDEEYLSIRGFSVSFLYFILLFIVAITVVILIKIVGIMLVIALMTIPSATSALITKTMKKMIAFSILLSFIYIISGIVVSFTVERIPTGATIILLAGFGYYLFFILHLFQKKFRK